MKAPAGAEGATAKDKLTYAYCLVLGREPDGGGMEGWSKRLATDMSIERIVIAMLQSDEFSKLYALPQLSKREYVTLIHRLLLGADPPDKALDQAVAELDARNISDLPLRLSTLKSSTRCIPRSLPS